MTRFDRIIDKIAQDLHGGKLKPEQLSQELITQTYNELNDGASNGYGKDWKKFPADGKGSLPNELKKNIYAFSGAKTYAQLEALNQLLYDKDGKLRPFNEFKVLAKQLNRQYNENYLQAEWQTARTAAQMAEKWERLQETKDIFPNLKFRTVGDDRVRDSHAKLNGIIKPIDDDFWSKYYPPLDWRCRCDVVATAEYITNDKEEDLPQPQFKGNVGKDKEIFTKKGTFFKLAATNQNAVRNLELSKLNAPYETVYRTKKGKTVQVNIYADPSDLVDNIASAKKIADTLKLNVQIRPHINTNIAVGVKNPEYLIKDKLSELKVNFNKNNYNGIRNALDSAKEQGAKIVVFDFSKSFKNLDIITVNRIIKGKINKVRGKSFDELIIIHNKKVINITREDIVNDLLLEELKKLKADS